MSESLTYQTEVTPTRDQVHTPFAQTMGYVAVTAALFALGALWVNVRFCEQCVPGSAG